MINILQNYKNQLSDQINKINLETVKSIIDELENTKMKNGKIYVIGNGGSAATASHMVNDLGVGLKRRGIRNFDIESLADNVPVITAIGNDIGYENIFYAQLKDKIKTNDLLIAISCSGNSPNIVKAIHYAKEQNIKIIGLTGFDGGKLRDLADISFHIETDQHQYGLVEDLHMILDHIIYTYFIDITPSK